VNSTNLAHTVKYWLFASSKTMTERYHKSEFGNSTLGLGPPFSSPVCYQGLKTVVVPLPDDLPFAELQKRPSSALQPEWIQRARPKFRSTPLPAPPVDVSYLLLYLIHLSGHGPVPPPPGPAARSRFLPRGVRRLGNSSKTTSGARNSFSAAPVSPLSRACKSPRNLRITSRFAHFRLPNGGSPPPVAVPSTGLSFSSVRAGAFVSIFLGLGRFLPGRFPR